MRQLSGQDAGFLYSDTPHANANVTFVQIYDQSTAPGGLVRFKSILARIQSRLHRSPVFRNKLLRVPLELDFPYWVEDEHFDLEYHVRHIALPKPGDWRQFCIQASRIHSRALDLNRPLWEIYVIEGLDSVDELPSGSFAVLTKVHHSAIDIESRNELVTVLHDTAPVPPPDAPPEPWFPESPPSALSLMWRGAFAAMLSPLRWVGPLTRYMPAALAFATDVLRPEPGVAATRFHSVVSAHRVFDTRRFLLEEFQRISCLVPGASVDDAVTAVCAGGLRRYLADQAELPEADLVGLLSPQRPVLLGTDREDPVERLRWIHSQTISAAELPPSGQPSCAIVKLPAFEQPMFLIGARLTYVSAILPIADGLGLVFAVTHYDGRVVISPTSCRELMPDPQAFTQCVRNSFQEYLALTPAAGLRQVVKRASTSARRGPAAPTARKAATATRAAPGGRRRSTVPGH